MRVFFPIVLIIAALALLVPGVTRPVLTLEGKIDKSVAKQVLK